MKKKTEAKSPSGLSSQSPAISVIIPVYQNIKTLRELYRRLHQVLTTLLLPYEMLFVDDACPQGSLAVLEQLAQEDPQVAALALERNVGQHQAVLTALRHTRGKWVVVIDADLQDIPEAIPELLDKLREGPTAVFARRRGRFESPFRLITSRLFKGLLHMLCDIPMDAGFFVAMNRQMVERVLAFGNPHSSLIAMVGCTGLPITSIPVIRTRRPVGNSAYSSWKRFKLGYNTIKWVLAQKWLPGCSTSSRYPDKSSVKAYIGVRFASTTERTPEVTERA